MNKQEDKFFEMYRDSFQDFAPEAPASIYAGVRKKMMWSNFMTFNLSTLNVWYLGLILLGGLGTIGYVSAETSMGQMTAQHDVLDSFKAPQIAHVATANQDNTVTVSLDEVKPAKTVVAPSKPWTPKPAKSSNDTAVNLGADLADDNSADNASACVEKTEPKVEAKPEPEMTTMETIKPEVVAPFSIANALQIDVTDLISQINDPSAEKITIKVPVTLPATNE